MAESVSRSARSLAPASNEPGPSPIRSASPPGARPALTSADAAVEGPAGFVIAQQWGRRDFFTRRLLAVADAIGILMAMGAASLWVGVRELPFGLLLLSL